VTYGVDRAKAIAKMSAALDGFYSRGVQHNIVFLSALINHTRFTEGRLTTRFIAKNTLTVLTPTMWCTTIPPFWLPSLPL